MENEFIHDPLDFACEKAGSGSREHVNNPFAGEWGAAALTVVSELASVPRAASVTRVDGFSNDFIVVYLNAFGSVAWPPYQVDRDFYNASRMPF